MAIARSGAFILGGLLIGALACSPAAPDAAHPTPDSTGNASTSSSADAAPTTETATAPTAEPTASGTSSEGPAPVATSAATTLAPLNEEEQKEAETKCKPIMTAMGAAKKKSPGLSALAVLEQVLASPSTFGAPVASGASAPSPAAMKTDVLDRCKTLLRRGIAAYEQAVLEAEATTVLTRIARYAVQAYERELPTRVGPPAHMLCGSATPVPAKLGDLATATYTSQESDWQSGGWACLKFQLTGQAQHFQYEVQSDADGKGFTAIARLPPNAAGITVELRLRGVVKNNAVALEKLQRVERK